VSGAPTPGPDAACAWAPLAGTQRLHLRARLRDRVRRHFADTGGLEVDTPVLSAAAAVEPHIEPLRTRAAAAPGAPLYLRASPELAMKRLLAAGVGDCWQLARVFRDGERGSVHHPEFDLLEWYRLGHDHHALMSDVAHLLAATLGGEREVPAAERIAYAEAFRRHLGIDPLSAELEALRRMAQDHGIDTGGGGLDRDALLDGLWAVAVAPSLAPDGPTFVHDWPIGQAVLARAHPDDPRLAARFELYWGALELANGFCELADVEEQRRRFVAANARRVDNGLAPLPLDERFLAALAAGLPDCAGVALGFDRLVMVAAGAERLDEVVAFPVERA